MNRTPLSRRRLCPRQQVPLGCDFFRACAGAQPVLNFRDVNRVDSAREDFHQIESFGQIALFQFLQRLSGGAHQAAMGEASKVLEYDVAFAHGPWRHSGLDANAF